MTPTTAPDVHAALASPIRRQLLQLLRDGLGPRDARELAEATGLNQTTVRFHLDVLVHAGLLLRRPDRKGGVGRPRTVFLPLAEEPAGTSATAYQGLARMLAANLADSAKERVRRAEHVGVEWSRALVAQVDGSAKPGVPDIARQVAALFTELAFDPEIAAESGTARDQPDSGRDESPAGAQILLHSCPFRGLAREQPEVVCSIHLGLLTGALERLGAAGTSSRLLPFVDPELCIVELGERADQAPGPPRRRVEHR